MRESIPVSTSPKGRLAMRALEDFGRRPFHDVTVGELAAGAGVTTGALYHLDSKLGLRRLSAATRRSAACWIGWRVRPPPALAMGLPLRHGALTVGFDFAVGQGFVRLLGEAHPARDLDPVADMLTRTSRGGRIPIGEVLAAAWRAALMAVAEGASPHQARAALDLLSVNEEALSRGTPRPGRRSSKS